LDQEDINKQEFLKTISVEDIEVIYDKFAILSQKYHNAFREKHKLEYNYMIKHKIDYEIMEHELRKHLDSLKDYNMPEYTKLMNVFNKINKYYQSEQ
jgi:hypothetical protein